MLDLRIYAGMLLVLGGAWMLFLTFAFATLSAGGLEHGSLEWWTTALGAMFEESATFIFVVGVIGGVGLFLYRPGMKMTAARPLAVTGVLAVLLGLFLWAASRERQWMEGCSPNPDGTKHVVKKYRNWFGQGRTVETDQP